jgi:hypothetical protein
MADVMADVMDGTMAGAGVMAAALADHGAIPGMIRSWMATGRLARGIPHGQRMTSRRSRIRRAADVAAVVVVAARSQPCATPAAP